MTNRYYLNRFQSIKPQFCSKQTDGYQWMANAYEKVSLNRGEAFDKDQFLKLCRRVGCSAEQISERYHELEDFIHGDFSNMKIFQLDRSPHGLGMEERMKLFSEKIEKRFHELYTHDQSAPDSLVHVSCTGYTSPSAAQILVANKNWGRTTRVNHFYHMGCYAAFPAVSHATGFLAYSPLNKRVDIVHTELCTLHFNPADPSLEQLVVQSLFADGIIKYSISNEVVSEGFEVLTVNEEIIPDSLDAMTWSTSDWGMKMTLSRSVPLLISKNIKGFISTLTKKGAFDLHSRYGDTIFAIHPGGPKILDQIESILELKQNQIRHSREILYTRGNMSSGTIPHIWQLIESDETVPKNTPIISLAFGPGLTVCGSLMLKL